MSLVSERPATSASYSTSLFVALKLHLMACWTMSHCGEIKTIPMSVPLMLLEPSTERVHLEVRHLVLPSSSLLACVRALRVKSVMKSLLEHVT